MSGSKWMGEVVLVAVKMCKINECVGGSARSGEGQGAWVVVVWDNVTLKCPIIIIA